MDSVYVKEMKSVKQGQVLRTGGRTGNACGGVAHVHIKVFDDRFCSDFLNGCLLDPEDFISTQFDSTGTRIIGNCN